MLDEVYPHLRCARYLAVYYTSSDDGALDASVQLVSFDGGQCNPSWRAVRPLPEGGGFFENVWRSFRENGNVE